MTVAAKERSLRGPRLDPDRLFESGDRSLEDVLNVLDDGLETRGTSTCPVCGGTLVADGEAGDARCIACAASLD